MNIAGRFAANGNQTKENLVHIKDGRSTGEWRDSQDGKE